MRHCRTTDRLWRHHRIVWCVSDRNLACAILTRRKTLSDDEIRVCLLPWRLYVLSHSPTTVPGGGLGPLAHSKQGLLAYPSSGDWDVAPLVQHRTSTPPTQIRFPDAARDFSPRVHFTVSVHPRGQLHAFTSVRTLKIPQSPCQSSMDYGSTETSSMHRRLVSATLSQLAFPGGKQPRIPHGKIPFGTIQLQKVKSRAIKGFFCCAWSRSECSLECSNKCQEFCLTCDLKTSVLLGYDLRGSLGVKYLVTNS